MVKNGDMTCPRRDYEEEVIDGVTENHYESKSDSTDYVRLSGVSRPVDVDSGLRKKTRGIDPESNEATKEYGADLQAGAKMSPKTSKGPGAGAYDAEQKQDKKLNRKGRRKRSIAKAGEKTQSPQGSPKLPQLPTAPVPPGQLEGMRPQVTTAGPDSCQSPLLVLNEMVASESGRVVYSFPEPPKAALNMPAMYVAHALYEGETYTGSGPSKLIAKNLCAEQIIQVIVTKKCVEKQALEAAGETTKLEDETPWTALASLAIYKLFNDWQIINGTTETDKTKGKHEHKKRKGRREREELKEAESENKRARVDKKRKEKELRETESLNRRARVDTASYCLVCQQSGHEMSTKCATCLACGGKGHVRKDCDAPKVVKSEGENIEQNEKENKSSDKMEVNNNKLKHEDGEENGISINNREEDDSEKKREFDDLQKDNGTTRESNPCSDAPHVDCSSSPPNEIEILHHQVADCVKKRLDMYMVGQAGMEHKHMKIKDSDEYTRLAKFFSHKLRAQIKETYEQYNRTLEGVAITADHKEQIKVEIDMYFDTQPVIV